MERSSNVLLFLLLLLFFVAMAASSSKQMPDEQLGMSLAATKHNHRHSGLSDADMAMTSLPPPFSSKCPGACQYRCSKTAYKKPCLFYCQKCCYACKCVPSGTYANKEKCPCYNNWKTKRGGPKCP